MKEKQNKNAIRIGRLILESNSTRIKELANVADKILTKHKDIIKEEYTRRYVWLKTFV